jgi:hypothetical protein
MRRHNGHIRERSPGSWEIRYDLGTDPTTGKRRIATATIHRDRRAAENELRRLLRTREMVIFLTMPAMRRSLRDREVSTCQSQCCASLPQACFKHASSLLQACGNAG